jgi:HAE1 family hydrophobic/amphiphilic exporter-1
MLSGSAERPSLVPGASWRAFRDESRSILERWRSQPRFWVPLVLVLTWLVARLVAGTSFEVIGKLLLALLWAAVFVWRWLMAPLLGGLFRVATTPALYVTNVVMNALTRRYPSAIRWGVTHPAAIALVTLVCMAATALVVTRLDSELLPEVHQGEITFEVSLPVGTPLEQTAALLTPLESAILDEREHIDALLLTLGFDPTTSQRSDEGEHTARFKLLLDSSDPAVEASVVARLRRRLAAIPDVGARVVRPVLFSFQTPIEVEVHGTDLAQLRRLAERVRHTLTSLPELADVETTQRPGAPEVQIVYNRDQLSRYGLNITSVAEQVRDAVKGREASRYNLGDRRVPIVVRFEQDDRREVLDVRDFLVNPGGEHPIPLSSVAEVTLAEGPSEVRRVDGRRVALVTASVASGSLGAAVARVQETLQTQIEWPSETSFFVAGQSQEWERSRTSLMLALALSIFLVYVIMAAQFESLIQPLVIMITIPLAFLGTMLALWVLGISLSVVVFLGMIMLAGIVVNNAIVLVDYINTLRARGMDRTEAIVEAGSVRLRPILMTTATTVLGLLPMALGLGNGAEIRTPMAIAVISGLISSTVLTLVIIPSIYSMLDGLQVFATSPSSVRAGADAEGIRP